MALVDIWPPEGVPAYDADGDLIASTGITVTWSAYYQSQVRAGNILLYDPLDQGPAETSETLVGSQTKALLASDLETRVGAFDGAVIQLDGHTSRLDGGGGPVVWVEGSSTTANNGTVFGSTSAGRWKRIYSGCINAAWFGAFPDATDCRAALQAALAVGVPVVLPAGTSYYRVDGSLTITSGGLAGEHRIGTGSLPSATIVFRSCTSTTQGAIIIPVSGSSAGVVLLENLNIHASSWDGTTGCLGYGVEIIAKTKMVNVQVSGFKKSNIWMHHDMSQNGPYESSLENVESIYSGVHGLLIGNGANSVTLRNYSGKWNGCTSFGVAPSGSGTGDGLKISNTSDGGAWPSYNPETLSIRGGDCSYNAGYGWDIDSVQNAYIVTGYCEGNFTDQVRVGQVVRTRVQISQLAGGTSGFTDGMSYGPYYYESSVWYGGKRLAPADDYQFVSSPTVDDESGGVVQGTVARAIYTSRSTTAEHTTAIVTNATSDGTSFDAAAQSVATYRGYGTYYLGIGSGARHLKVGDNFVRLPDILQWATTTGWDSPYTSIDRGTAAPGSGAYAVGALRFNSSPSSGGYVGWVCTVAGSPGTWKGFGVIA